MTWIRDGPKCLNAKNITEAIVGRFAQTRPGPQTRPGRLDPPRPPRRRLDPPRPPRPPLTPWCRCPPA
ncbi:unnamed protein product [Prunus armeniaca]